MKPATLTHALIIPMTVSRLLSWCGKPLRSIRADHVATAAEAVTCAGCIEAMRHAQTILAVWVPRLPSEAP